MPDDQTLSQLAGWLLGAPVRIVAILIGAAILTRVAAAPSSAR